ncbi:hypothetical protein LY76DRAFT_648013 [Colletotrichum caudatum]|nr:hypothetical protein LY76DRAFT_648013 [Colletotrichum caudatum]
MLAFHFDGHGTEDFEGDVQPNAPMDPAQYYCLLQKNKHEEKFFNGVNGSNGTNGSP